jgi:hypothetical protein
MFTLWKITDINILLRYSPRLYTLIRVYIIIINFRPSNDIAASFSCKIY